MEALLATEMSVPLHQIMFLMVLLDRCTFVWIPEIGIDFSPTYLFFTGETSLTSSLF